MKLYSWLTVVLTLVLCAAPVVGQTTTTTSATTTQTAAQKAAAAQAARNKEIEAKKQADLKRAEEQRKLDEQKKLAAAKAAKGVTGATGTTGIPGTTAATATPATTPVTTTATPVQAAAPAAATPWGMAPTTSQAAGQTGGANALTSILATFKNGDLTWNSFGCLRAGTRAFCDFDVLNRTPYQISTSNQALYRSFTLVLGGGRVVGPTLVTFVDGDGNTFTTAALSANAPVRMLMQFDNVPETLPTVSMTMNSARADGLPVSPMPAALANGGVPARVAAQRSTAGTQTATTPTSGNGTGGATGLTSQANSAVQKANSAKTGLSGLLSGAKSTISH